MSVFRVPMDEWPDGYVAVAVETVVRGGRRVPLSCSYAVVAGGRITSAHHLQIAWWRPEERGDAELRAAVASAEATRTLSPEDLLEGGTPARVLDVLAALLAGASVRATLVVTYDPTRRLGCLLDAVTRPAEYEVGPLWVVNTAALGPSRRPRAQRAVSVLPDVMSAYRDIGSPGGPLHPQDRLFGVLATHRIYEHSKRSQDRASRVVA